jgi:regulator of PEP synthase PpsR (kinase-PPPase family)
MAGVMEEPGLVLFTIVDHVLREALQDECRRRQIPSVSVLDPVLAAFGALLGAQSREQPGRQHVMDAEYFHRIDAMHYCMAHDDGQNADHLVEAEVILVGVSRTSKTPTCIYLANRGVKAANIPIVPGLPLPNAIEEPRSGQFIVGLTASPERLVQIRRNRLLALSQTQDTDYVDMEAVKQEVAYARKLFTKRGWPVIDVTRRSIEETAAAIMGLRAGREATTDGAPPRRTG